MILELVDGFESELTLKPPVAATHKYLLLTILWILTMGSGVSVGEAVTVGDIVGDDVGEAVLKEKSAVFT